MEGSKEDVHSRRKGKFLWEMNNQIISISIQGKERVLLVLMLIWKRKQLTVGFMSFTKLIVCEFKMQIQKKTNVKVKENLRNYLYGLGMIRNCLTKSEAQLPWAGDFCCSRILLADGVMSRASMCARGKHLPLC